LFDETVSSDSYTLSVDLAAQTVVMPDGSSVSFAIDEHRKHCLINGLDDIGVTLEQQDAIRAFEVAYRERHPWIFMKN
jgi:3-isopropylmalate/(R)-2-methylmalate dehydratase small subunit